MHAGRPGKYIELTFPKLFNQFHFFFWTEVHCKVLSFLEMHTLQNAVYGIVYRISRLEISKDKELEDASRDWDAVWYDAYIRAPEVFVVESDGLEVDSLHIAFKLDY